MRQRYMFFRVYAKHMFVGLLWVETDGTHSFRYASGGWKYGQACIGRVKQYKQLNLRRES